MKRKICSLILLSFIIACIPQQDEQRLSDESHWYILKNGNLNAIAEPGITGNHTYLPWTIQERITDFSMFHKKFYFTVNGYGLVALGTHGNPQYRYTLLYNEKTFQYKTITSLIPLEEALLCHIYVNTTLFPFDVAAINTTHENLIKLIPQKEICYIQPIQPPLQKEKPGWELVSFVPTDRYHYYCEWKLSTVMYSDFEYSMYNFTAKKEKKISRDEFRKAYGFTPIEHEDNPIQLRTLCKSIINQTTYNPDNTTFHFLIKSKETNLIQRYIHNAKTEITSQLFEIVAIPMFKNELTYYALLPAGNMCYVHTDRGTIKNISLPGLPQGFSYTGFFIDNRTIFASWEESRFIDVGAAGLLVFKSRQL